MLLKESILYLINFRLNKVCFHRTYKSARARACDAGASCAHLGLFDDDRFYGVCGTTFLSLIFLSPLTPSVLLFVILKD